MLLGRELLLEAGEAALHGALSGHGRLLLLTGEAGIGKTTLAGELLDRAAASGALIRAGACWETDNLPPLTPWLDALRRPGDDACAQAAAQLEGATDPAVTDAAGAWRARGRRFASVVDALRSSADGQPQVVLLEDLHWADSESLELLVAVAAHLPTMRVLVIGTCRDDERSPRALGSIGGNADRLALPGLGDPAVGALLEGVLGRATTEEERSEVRRQTGGNPLFVTQVARLLATGSTGLPQGVRDVLARRFAHLSAPCDAVVGAASVLGVELDERTLEAMCGVPVADALTEAATTRLMMPIEDVPHRWRFAHALVQAARYDLLGSKERTAWHRAALRALQDRPGASASVLAHHGARADLGPDDPLVASALIQAGVEAVERLAWADAEAAFTRAVSAAPPGPDGAPLQAEAWLGIGSARLRSGRTDAREAFDQAVELGRRAGRSDLVARAALGFSIGLGGFEVRLLDHHQIELLEEAAATLDATGPLLPLVLARLSVAVAFVEPSERRVELAERAVSLARAADDQLALGHALAAWCDAHAGPAAVDPRLAAASEVISLGQRTGDLPLELLGRRLRVVALLERNDHALAEAEVSLYERGAAALGDPLYTWYGSLWRATMAAAAGQPDVAHREAEDAESLGLLGGSTNSRLLVEVHRLMVAADRRDHTAIEQAMATVMHEAPEVIGPYADITYAYNSVALGDPAEGRRHLARLSPDRLDALPSDSEWLPVMAQLAYATARAEHMDLVGYLRERLAPLAGCGAVEGIGAYLHGPVDRFLAALAAVAGDHRAARGHADAAEAAASGAGSVVRALTDLDSAWSLRRSPEPDDQRRSIELARRAAAALTRADLAVLASEADALAQPSTVPPADTGTTARPEPSVVRQGDSWAWSWEGRTTHLRHAKGVADLAVLLARAGREVHVRELDGSDGEHLSRQDRLDPTAVEQYRQRLHDLEGDLEEADRHGDVGRAAVLAAERDVLVDELTRSFGLQGRPRSVANDPDERLRKAVSARVRASIDRIEELDPGLGRHLRSSVRTGFWCSYQPERPTRWVVVPR